MAVKDFLFVLEKEFFLQIARVLRVDLILGKALRWSIQHCKQITYVWLIRHRKRRTLGIYLIEKQFDEQTILRKRISLLSRYFLIRQIFKLLVFIRSSRLASFDIRTRQNSLVCEASCAGLISWCLLNQILSFWKLWKTRWIGDCHCPWTLAYCLSFFIVLTNQCLVIHT